MPAPAPLLLRPLAWLALQAQLLALALASSLVNICAFVLYPVLPRATGRRLGRATIAHGYRGYWRFTRPFGLLRLEAEALDALRDVPGLVIVANHPSLLDAMMLVARLPKSACVMKASLMRNPFLAAGALLARYIPNDSAHGMVRQAVADLREGGQLLMFPEGTRTTHAPINTFQPGFALIAKHAKAPIQTVFIDTHSPYLGKGWPLWRLPPLPIEFSVRLGRRFEPRADHEALTREIEAYFAAGVIVPPQAGGAR
ncbi:MAG: 1-acyl-sn-glycerol-3-phosphate acyltransferase [Burkholderiales bacterium]|nr:1-acyl-sn-glycerol-3-phosphate acyltransferase [Burkholderiales bacterium]